MRLRNILPLVALLAAPAFAQDVHFGLSAGVNKAMGDAKDLGFDKIGLGIGVDLGIEFKGGHVLRPRLDYTKTSHKDFSDVTLATTTFGVDYNYFVSGKAAEGFYLIAGIGRANTKVEYPGGSDSESGMAYAAGFGFNFTQLVGANLRYTSAKADALRNNALNASVTFRF